MKIISWIKNLKVSNKLNLLGGLSCAALILIVIIGYLSLHNTSKTINDLYKNKLMSVQLISDIMLQESNNFGIILHLTLQDNLKDKNAHIGELDEVAKTKGELEKEYQIVKLSDFEREKYTDYKKAEEKYKKIQKKIEKSSFKSEDRKARKVYFDELEPVYDQKTEILNELMEYAENAAKKYSEESAAKNTITQYVFIIIAVISIALLIALGLFITEIITKPLGEITEKLQEVSKGNLAIKEIELDTEDEIGILARSTNKMLASLKTLITKVSSSAEEVSAGSEQMNASAEQTALGAQQTATSIAQLAEGSQEQANNITKALENINIINKAVQKISENADETVELSKQTEEDAGSGCSESKEAAAKINEIKTIATDVATSINELGKLSTEIEQIVEIIKNIASQTNLLALNAAIEAARAGEQGKGFAVVADEVKNLAGESASASDKITMMIKEIQNKTTEAVASMNSTVVEVDNGVHLVENTGNSLAKILKAAKLSTEQIVEITQEVKSLASNSDSVVGMMENLSSITEQASASAQEISSVSQEQSASTQEISASSQSLAKVAEGLQKQVSEFKL